MERRFNLASMAFLTGIGIILGYIEGIFFPQGVALGIKLGVSNLVVLFALMKYGVFQAYIVATAKTILLGLMFSSVSAVIYGLTGVFFSITIMWPLKKLLFPNRISLIGISVAGSCAFNVGQVAVASAITKSAAPLLLLSYMLPLSVVTGSIVAFITMLVLNRLSKSRD